MLTPVERRLVRSIETPHLHEATDGERGSHHKNVGELIATTHKMIHETTQFGTNNSPTRLRYPSLYPQWPSSASFPSKQIGHSILGDYGMATTSLNMSRRLLNSAFKITILFSGYSGTEQRRRISHDGRGNPTQLPHSIDDLRISTAHLSLRQHAEDRWFSGCHLGQK